MVVRKTRPLPIECVARGYLSGSGWKEYRSTGKICGIGLPPGLEESDKLPEVIFTPAIKATSGHDENISFTQAAEILGKPLAEKVRNVTLEIYRRAATYAEKHDILLADTKFEFGMLNDELIWIDEALTPDSSRFWLATEYKPVAPSVLSTNSLCVTTSNVSSGQKRHLGRSAPGSGRGNTCQIQGSVSDPGRARIGLECRPHQIQKPNGRESEVVRDQLEGLVVQMVERGILFDEAVGEFEKRFIKRVLERTEGNQSRAAVVLGIHRNTLSRKISEYKLDHRRGKSR